MPTAPSLIGVATAASAALTTSQATASLTWQTNDDVTVVVMTGGTSDVSLSVATSGSGLAFGTAKQSHPSAAADCGAAVWQARATAGSSGTFTGTTGGNDYMFVAAVVTRNSGGLGKTALVNGSAAHTLALTGTAADSLIGWGVGDWSASAVGSFSPAATSHSSASPGPSALPVSALITGQWTYYFGLIDDQTSAGSVSYGTTSTSTNQTIVIFEILGSGGAAAVNPRVPRMSPVPIIRAANF
jgi:hypothetical protein